MTLKSDITKSELIYRLFDDFEDSKMADGVNFTVEQYRNCTR